MSKFIERYSRQIILKDVGPSGQNKILKSNVLVIGAGGLGCTVVDLLCRAGVGQIGIVDNDIVNLSNIHRQCLYNTNDVNKVKVKVLKEKIKNINPDVKIKIYEKRILNNNAKSLVKNYDIIIDGSDNFKTKLLLNKICLKLNKKLIVGAIGKFQGHIFSLNFKKKNTACLKCFYQSTPSDKLLNCEIDGVIGPTAALVGSIQSSEALKLMLGIGKDLYNKLLVLNLLSLEFRSINFKKRKNCICKK